MYLDVVVLAKKVRMPALIVEVVGGVVRVLVGIIGGLAMERY